MTPSTVEEAADAIRKGRPALIPTDTVYGLAADPRNPSAIAKLFEIKGRPDTNPLPILVGSIDDAKLCANPWPKTAHALAEALWPGPLTIVVPKADWVPKEVVAGNKTVGLRQPNHPLTLQLLNLTGPLACTSANRSGQTPINTPDNVPIEFTNANLTILSAGTLPASQPSTVIDVSQSTMNILRPGPISKATITNILR